MDTIQIETNRSDRGHAEWENNKMYYPLVLAFFNLFDNLKPYEYNTGDTVRIVFYGNTVSWQRKTVELQQGLALIELGKQINEGLEYMYQKGKTDGKNLLMQLNSGEVTETQFLK